jgi:GDPmannose 4,6-dehydratase
MWLLLQHHTAEDITICSGKSIFLKDIIYYIFDKLSVSYTKLEIDKTLFRPVDIEDMYGDNTKAKNIIGWDYHWDFFKALDLILEEELLNFN